MSGLIGMGMAAYAVEVMSFGLGLFLYKRLGYSARIYFLAHFDWATVWKSFRFGVFEMLGSGIWGVGQSVEILITQSRLVNYAEVWGNWVLAQNFVYGFNAIASLYEGLMPSISEAISHGKKMLGQYYSAIAYKWGGMLSAMLGSMMLAVADRFILGASGPEFVRAAIYAIPLLLWGSVQFGSWVSDMVQRGSNRPYLMMLMTLTEQTIRITLAILLVSTLPDQCADPGIFCRYHDQGHPVVFREQPLLLPAEVLFLAVVVCTDPGRIGKLCHPALGHRAGLAQ